MESKIRSSGIDIIGNTPWGTHFCLFYQTKEDLIDILVPYFKAGLENNEYCMWVTSEPLNEKEAEKAIRVAMPNFDDYLKKKQIEIVHYTEWYLRDGVFDLDRVLNGWIEKLENAIENGFEGLRITGNTAWLEKKDWKDFRDYEEEINNVIGNFQMMAICTYSLEKCGSFELLDVIKNHQFALLHRNGRWESFKSMEQIVLERKFKEAELRYRSTFEQSPDGIMILDLETTRAIEFNNAMCDVLGYSREEFAELKVADYDAIEDPSDARAHIEKVLQQGIDDFETKMRTKKGDIKDIHVIAKVIELSGKKYIQSIWRDITERKKTEQKLKESEQRLKKFMKSATDGFVLFDSKLNYIDINKVTLQILGMTKDDLIGKNILDIVPNLKETGRYNSYLDVLKTGNPFSTEDVIYNRLDGSFSSHLSVRAFKVGDDLGVIFTDVTERKKSERKIKKIKDRLVRLTDNADEAIFRVGAKGGQVIYVNPAAERLFGYTKAEWISNPHLGEQIILPNFVERQKEIIEELNKNRKPIKNAILGWRAKDGREVIMEYTIIPIIDDNGQLAYFESIGRDITERKKAERKIKESESKLRGIMNSITDQVCVLDRNLDILYINSVTEEIYGSIALGSKCYQVYHGLDEPCSDCQVRRTFEDSEVHNKECTRSIGEESRYCWCVSNVFERDEEGRPISVVEVSRDITERKKIEQELKDSEQKWRALSENSPAHIMLLDREHKVIFINRTVPDLSKEEVIGTSIYDYTPQEFHKVSRDCYNSVWETGDSSSFHTSYKTKEGDIKYFDMWIGPVIQSGKVVALVSHGMDVTKRKKKEAKLQLQSEIIENMSEGVYLIKLDDGIIVYTNPSFEMMFGYNPGEMIGKNVAIVNAPTDKTPEEIREIIIGILKDTGEWHGEVLNVKKDGWLFWCYANVSLFDHPEYGMVIVSVHTDITERKKIEEELEESEERYRTIINFLGDPMHVIDRNYKIIVINETLKKWVKNLNLDTKIIGKTPKEAWPFLPDLTMGEYHSIFNNGNPVVTIGSVIINNNEITTETRKIPIFKEEKVVQIITLIRDITESMEAEQKLKESKHDLGERVKELTCLYELSKLVENPVISFGNILNGTLNLIPPAFQFPDIITARITYNGREYKRDYYEETEWKLSTMIEINNEPLLIEVCHLENKPFLKEEHELINEIGIRLKTTFEEKEVQKKLQLSEDKYHTLFESSVDGIASADMEGNVIDANNAFLDMLGYSKEEFLKLSIRQLTPSKWHEKEDNLMIAQLSLEGDSRVYEKEYIKKDGTIIPVNIRFWIVKDVQGDPIMTWAIVRDITESKKAKEEIANLAKFPSENPYPVLRVNMNNLLYINSSGKNLLKINDDDYKIPEFLRTKIKETATNNAITEVEIDINNRVYSFNIAPVLNSNYLNIYGMDITERKQVEYKLKEINELKSEFLRRASHELKTPLISIKGFSDLILAVHSQQLSPDIRSKLNEINLGCERLQNIINNLLKTSKLESPVLTPKIQREDLSFLLKFCVHELKSIAEARNQQVSLDIHDGQYACFEKEEIHDVISNLLTNAIKYTPPNGRIKLKTEITGDFVTISVEDNGIGFTEADKAKIFQQFGKIERYGQGLDLGIDGTGLGLYISKRIVESHGGEIWMESEGKNNGSTFYFTVPMNID